MPDTRADSPAVVVLLTELVALGPLSTDLYLPSLPHIARAFATDAGTVQLTLSVFMAGFALSQLVYGPLSDRFGRRPVLIGGVSLYLAASVACALAPSMAALIGFRLLQAVGACAGPVLARAVVRDVFGRTRAATVLAYLAMAMALAPAFGPILGGYLQVWFGWPAAFVALAAVAAVNLVATCVLLPETNRWRDPSATRPRRLLANYRSLAADRRYRGYVAVMALAFSGIFAFISGSSFVLIDGLGLSPAAFGVSFAAIVAGYIAGNFATARLSARLGIDRMIRLGHVALLAGGLSGGALALVGAHSVASVIAPMAVYMVGTGLVLPNAIAGAVGPYPTMAGAASALLGFVQMSLAAAVGVLVGQLSDGRPHGMALTIAALAVLVFAAERRILRPLVSASAG